MRNKTKKIIREDIRLTCGLSGVMKDDVDALRLYSTEFDEDRMQETIQEINETIDKIIDILARIEYMLYLEKMRSSNLG